MFHRPAQLARRARCPHLALVCLGLLGAGMERVGSATAATVSRITGVPASAAAGQRLTLTLHGPASGTVRVFLIRGVRPAKSTRAIARARLHHGRARVRVTMPSLPGTARRNLVACVAVGCSAAVPLTIRVAQIPPSPTPTPTPPRVTPTPTPTTPRETTTPNTTPPRDTPTPAAQPSSTPSPTPTSAAGGVPSSAGYVITLVGA